MARPAKNGLDYFPLDVGVFEDDKIDLIQSQHGAMGVVVWLRLLCLIYKDNGYFYQWDETKALLLSRRVGGGCTPEAVEGIVASCLRWSLFDRALFARTKALSSPGVQRRYLHAIGVRAKKAAASGRKIAVDANLWLLDEEETAKGLVEIVPAGVFPGKNQGYSQEKPPLFQGTIPKEKDSKEKDSKGEKREKASGGEPAPTLLGYGEYGLVRLTKEQRGQLADRFGEAVAQAKIAHMDLYMQSRGVRYPDCFATLTDWLMQDAVGGQPGAAAAGGPAQYLGKRTSAHQFSQREYTDEEFNSLFDDLEQLAKEGAEEGGPLGGAAQKMPDTPPNL